MLFGTPTRQAVGECPVAQQVGAQRLVDDIPSCQHSGIVGVTRRQPAVPTRLQVCCVTRRQPVQPAVEPLLDDAVLIDDLDEGHPDQEEHQRPGPQLCSETHKTTDRLSGQRFVDLDSCCSADHAE